MIRFKKSKPKKALSSSFNESKAQDGDGKVILLCRR